MPEWNSKLINRLTDYGLTVSSSRPEGSHFRILFGTDDVTVELDLCPLGGNEKYFCSTGKFGIIYFGNDNLSDAQKRLVALFRNILANLESSFPPVPEFPVSGPEPAGMNEKELTFTQKINRKFYFCTVEESVHAFSDQKYYEAMVRLTQACNQNCPFCSGEKLVQTPAFDEIVRCFDYLASSLPNATVTITGGEPSLAGCFFDCLDYVCGLEKIREVQVQTNAVRFADEGFFRKMNRSSKIRYFVSFHSSRESVYDKCTATSGQYDKAVSGIKNILKSGASVIINCVICSLNKDFMDEYVRDVNALFRNSDNKPILHFSSMICSRYNPFAYKYLVRYSELAAILDRLEALKPELDLEMASFLSSTHASIPACFLKSEEQRNTNFSFNIENDEIGYEDLNRRWVKANTCRKCSHDSQCLGLPNEYARNFGFDELKALP